MKNRTSDIIKQIKIQSGLDRAHFFASGGELKQWRGMHKIYKDRKKEKSRNACRGNHRGRNN